MLVSSRHPQIFVPQQQRNGVDVRPLHSEPTRRRVAKIVEAKVGDFQLLAGAGKSHAHLLPCESLKERICRAGVSREGQGANSRLSSLVQIHDSPLAVLSLSEHDAAMGQVHVQPAKPNNSDRRMPVHAANARIGRNHSGEASRTALNSPGCK